MKITRDDLGGDDYGRYAETERVREVLQEARRRSTFEKKVYARIECMGRADVEDMKKRIPAEEQEHAVWSWLY